MLQHQVIFATQRPFDLENSMKVTAYDLENSKSTQPVIRRKKQVQIGQTVWALGLPLEKNINNNNNNNKHNRPPPAQCVFSLATAHDCHTFSDLFDSIRCF
jgi:hypothetical protein